MRLLLLRTTLLIVALCAGAVSGAAQKQGDGAQDEPPPPPPKSTGAGQESGWKRYELGGDSRDSISVLLPAAPQDFPGGKFKVSTDIELPVHLYLLSREATNYFAVFVNLPEASEGMPADQRGDIFYGCWRGLAGSVQRVLEQKVGGSFDVSSSPPQVGVTDGREWRAQDFSLGPQRGRAQIVFAGHRAYLLVAVWNPEDAKSVADASRFLKSFQVKMTRK